VTKDDAGLATVMAHEIGHAVARHGTESLIQQYGLQTIVQYIGGKYASLSASIANAAIALPFSREHEYEADHIGLIYMARAGYDPQKAIEFWQRMASQSSGAPPEFLSTHPSDQHRIEQLQKLLPEAQKAAKKYRPSP
jgi:predicted Zn-dependent protease